MKICHVGTGFTPIPPQISAATEEVVYYLTRELASLGCEINIVDIIDKKKFREPYIMEMPYFSFIKSTKSNSPGLILKRVSFSFFAARWLQEFGERFDIIHFHNQFPAYTFQLFAKLSSKKISTTVFTVHNPIWGLPDAEIPKNIRIKYVLEVEAIKQADKVIVVSETLRQHIIKRLGLKSSSITVIPNGVDTNVFHPSRATPTLRKELAPNGEKIVLCVGRICPFKGQKTLVESIPMITRKNPNVKFVFVGPIDDHRYFKDISDLIDSMSLRKYCLFTGTVPSHLVPAYFATADVCTVLSITEAGPPLTLFQAMSSARATVASAIPQNMEAAKEGDEIIFVDPLSLEEISAAVSRLLADEDIRKRIGDKARKTALRSYDWKATAKETLRMYENLVKKDKPQCNSF